MDDILELYGITDKPSKAKKKARNASDADDVLKLYGIVDNVLDTPPKPTETSSAGKGPVMVGDRVVDPAEITPGVAPPASTPQPSRLQRVHEAIDPSTVIPGVVGNALSKTGEYASAGADLFSRGVSGKDPNWLPRFPSRDPSTWTGGRIAQTVGGALGTVLSPLGGAIDATVVDPLTPVIGKDAADKAGMFVPLGPARRTATAVRELPNTRGVNKIVDMIGPENVPAMVERLQGNPRLRPMDTNDTLRVAGQSLVDPAQPRAMENIVSSVKRSADEAPEAVRGAYDAAMGPAPKILDELDRLSNQARAVGAAHINPALRDAKPVNITPVIEAIDAELKPGLQAVANPGTGLTLTDLQKELVQFKRQLTDGTSLRTDPDILHDVQSKMRARASELMKSAVGSERTLGRELMNYRMKLVDAIDASTPGNQYKTALSKYKDAKDIERSFEEGMEILKNQPGIKGVSTRPDALSRWMTKASPEEIEARRLGARDAIDQKMRSWRFEARRGTDISDIDFNRQKMEILFGKKEAEQLFKTLNDERDIALSNAKMLHGSKTAETLAARDAMKVREVSPPASSLPGWATMAGLGAGTLGGTEAGLMAAGSVMAANLAKRGYQKTGQLFDISRNNAFSKIISSQGPERDTALTRLMAHPKVLREQNKLQNLLPPP